MLRTVSLLAGLGGAFGSAQLPEFSQQYVQRLGGAVDALSQVVTDFDASAAAAGLTRSAALDQMTGTAFLDSRRTDMQRTFDRHAALQDKLTSLQRAGPFLRSYHLLSADSQVVRATAAAFQPALPLTVPGAIFAVLGFCLGSGALRFGVWVLRPPARSSA